MSASALVLRFPVVEAGGMPVAATPVWDVAALLKATQDTLQARFGAVVVKGELSGFSRAASGHCYFSLKDLDGESALLRCAMFRRAASLLDFVPADGQQLQLRGRLVLYEPRGELQFVVEGMRRIGDGALYEQFVRARARLQAAGWFDAARKRPIPAWPRSLGLITSTGAAALHDVLAALTRRAPQVRVVIYPSAVQGAQAAQALVAALRLAAARHEVDTLLLVRGGGSLEDLWCFNDEQLVQAIAASPIPVICGVGHEGDVTLADLVADLRAATPTAAAELAAPARADALLQLDRLAQRLQRRVRQIADLQAQRLDALTLRLGAPAKAVALRRQRLTSLDDRLRLALRQGAVGAAVAHRQWRMRLGRAVHEQLARRRQSLQAYGERLQALDPRRVLRRGFAWVTDGHGQPVQSLAAVTVGDLLRTVWADGAAQVEVRQREPDNEVGTEPPDRTADGAA